MISLSLLPTAPPRSFQPSAVRPSSPRYRAFGLAMGSSPPLRVYCRRLSPPRGGGCRPFKTRFRCAWSAQKAFGSPPAVTRRLIKQKARRHPKRKRSRLRHLVGVSFQGLFHSARRGAFHLSLAVLCSLSVAKEYLALRRGRRRFTRSFPCIALLREHPCGPARFSVRGLSPSAGRLSSRLT